MATMSFRARASTPTVLTALLTAAASVLGYVESTLIPSGVFPGIRIGLANIAVLIALSYLGPKGAVIVSLSRVLIVSLTVGTFGGPALILSFAGAAAALVAMIGLRFLGRHFSVVGWSVGGSVAHLVTQLVVVSILTGSISVLAVAPWALALALISGLVIGVASRSILSRVPSPSLAGT